MKTQPQVSRELHKSLPRYDSILLALDSSDHSNCATHLGAAIAKLWGGEITGAHVYAAKLHDMRFRQMEGGLPQQFREEQELERQRHIHDDLITRGLSIITDSYLDQAEHTCREAHVSFSRRTLEGKNYRALVEETNNGAYDLLVMGALGLGAVHGSRLGTVCQRVARRTKIDTLVIKEPSRSIASGPFVVAIDGSAKSYGGLTTALSLASKWNVEVKAVAVFDPYFHYVAFNRIADVLSEEAGKVFRFKEQEKLHEEIIDSGLAKIYQGHLDVATAIARDHGMEIETVLLDGKPHDAIQKYAAKINASLLVLGKLGIHSDLELDIGGNTENLLRDAHCALLISLRDYHPELDAIAEATTSWSNEALQAMERVPDFARNMARMAILRYAQKEGHTVITEKIVHQATSELCPNHAKEAMAGIVAAKETADVDAKHTGGFDALTWSVEADVILNKTDDPIVRDHLRLRAEKKARSEQSSRVETFHLDGFIAGPTAQRGPPQPHLQWEASALARLMRVPEGFMRDASRDRIEGYARRNNITSINQEVVEAVLAQARAAMRETIDSGSPTRTGRCPKGGKAESEQASVTRRGSDHHTADNSRSGKK